MNKMNTHENLMTAVGVLAFVHAILSGLVLGKVNLVKDIPLEVFLGISIVVNVIILALAIACYNTKNM